MVARRSRGVVERGHGSRSSRCQGAPSGTELDGRFRRLRIESLEGRRLLSALSWSTGPNLPVAVSAPAALEYSYSTYIFGGANGTTTPTAVYNLAAGATAWATSAALDRGRAGGGVGVPGYYGTTNDGSSEILNFGGTSGTQPTATTSWYNLEGATSYAMQTARAYFGYVTDSTASSSGGYYLYAIGGSGSNGQALASVERYDAANKAWTYLAPLPEALTHTTAADDGAGHIFVFGGLNSSGQPVAAVYRYTKATNTWDTVSSMPAALSDASSVYAAYGQIYVVGGKNSANQAVTTVEEYDPVLDQWTAGASLPVGLYDSAVVIDSNNQLNVIGGTSSSGPVATDYQIAVNPPPQGLPAYPMLTFPTSTYVYNYFVYNGQPETATAFAYASDGTTPIAGTFSYTYNGSSTPPTNAGTYNVVAQFTSGDPGYTNAVIAGQLIISPAYPQISVSGAGTFSYDAQPHGITATQVGIDGVTAVNGVMSYSYTNLGTSTTSSTTPVAPGTYAATAVFTSNDPNYYSWSNPQPGLNNNLYQIVIPNPAIPTNFTSTPASATSLTLSWNAAWQANASLSSVTSYTITERTTHSSGGGKGSHGSITVYTTIASGITSTSYTIAGLHAGSSHYYTINSVTNGQASPQTAYISATTAIAPTPFPSLYSNGVYIGGYPSPEAGKTNYFTISFPGTPAPSISLLSGPPTMSFNATTDVITYSPAPSELGYPTATFQATNIAGSTPATVAFHVQLQPVLVVTGGTFNFGPFDPSFGPSQHPATAAAYQADGVTPLAGTLTITYAAMPPAIQPYQAAPYDVGTYIATATFTSGNSNYGSATATATIAINPIAPTIVINGGPFSYTGAPQPASATAINIDGVTPVPGTFSFTYDGSPTVPSMPGTYNVTAAFTVDSAIRDYASTTANGSLVILLDSPLTVQSGTIHGGLQGTGSITMTGPGTATLNGPNSYTGGTFVTGGTLIVSEPDALPDGTSLTVGADGTFIFGSSQSTAGVAAPASGTAAATGPSTPIAVTSVLTNGPVAASALSTHSLVLERPVIKLSYAPALSAASSGKAEMSAAMSSVASDAVFASRRAAFDGIASSPNTPPSASASAWQAAEESSGDSSDQNKMTVEALDKVLARFGV